MSPVPEEARGIYMESGGGKNTALLILSALLTAAGAAVFLYCVLGDLGHRAWQVFLSNYLFWTGLAFGSVFLMSLMNLTSALWVRPFKRLVEAPAAFLPVAYFLFWLIFWGRKTLLPWITSPIPEKALYLNAPFFFAREGIGLLLLVLSAIALLYFSLKGDVEFLHRDGELSSERIQKLRQLQVGASIVFSGLYVLIMTYVSWDLVMSLSPKWVSTLFGAYFFTGCLYTAIAALSVSAGLAFYRTGLRHHIKSNNFHALGKTLLAFLMVFGDFLFSQYFLSWYGNKPDETRFFLERFRFEPWAGISIAAGIMILPFPFVVLLNRKIKMLPLPMMVLAIVILTGMWFERFLLVVPSLWTHETLPLGWIELIISLGFLGLMAFCMLVFLRLFPLLPLSDPLLRKDLEPAIQK